MDEKISYTDALNMTYAQLLEINTAMDVYIEKIKKSSKSKWYTSYFNIFIKYDIIEIYFIKVGGM